MDDVWLVWSECGAHDDFSRDLRGIFVSEELAEAHGERLKAHEPNLEKVEIEDREILSSLPAPAVHLEIKAHISPDGEELHYGPWTPGKGFGEIGGPLRDSWGTWSHEEPSYVSGSIKPWDSPRSPDLYVKASGTDSDAVEKEYSRLLAEAREQLASTPQPRSMRS